MGTSKLIILPHIKDISKNTKFLKLFGIGVAHKQVKSLQSVLCKPKDEVTKKQNKTSSAKQTFPVAKNTT